MHQRLLVFCLLMITGSVCLGQQPSQRKVPKQTPQNPEVKLDGMGDRIKAVDEPTLRVFLQIQLATFLWESKTKSAAAQAEIVATEAITNLQAHRSEIPEFYLNSFRTDLLALVNLHVPALAARLSEQYKLEPTPREQLRTAYTLLDSKEGINPAIEKVRGSLRSGQDLGNMISFFLHRLAGEKPDELPRLLSEILKPEEQKPGTFSLDTLRSLQYFYLRYPKEGASVELQARFGAVVLNAAKTALAGGEQDQVLKARELLKLALPAISATLPSLYPQASAQLAALSAQAPPPPANYTEADERIARSANPLDQMLAEADAADDPARTERLLVQAAQLALSKGELKLAVEIVLRVASTEKVYLMWRDQFLGEVVNKSVGKKDPANAEYAAAKIESALRRAAALRQIALYFFASEDVPRSRELMDRAFKLVADSENGAPKATAYFEMFAAFAKIDEQRIPEVSQAAIKVINGLLEPRPDDKPGSAARKEYVENLMMIAYHVIPAFRLLTRRDEQGTLGLAEGIRLREIKTAAIFAVVTTTPPVAASDRAGAASSN